MESNTLLDRCGDTARPKRSRNDDQRRWSESKPKKSSHCGHTYFHTLDHTLDIGAKHSTTTTTYRCELWRSTKRSDARKGQTLCTPCSAMHHSNASADYTLCATKTLGGEAHAWPDNCIPGGCPRGRRGEGRTGFWMNDSTHFPRVRTRPLVRLSRGTDTPAAPRWSTRAARGPRRAASATRDSRCCLRGRRR